MLNWNETQRIAELHGAIDDLVGARKGTRRMELCDKIAAGSGLLAAEAALLMLNNGGLDVSPDEFGELVQWISEHFKADAESPTVPNRAGGAPIGQQQQQQQQQHSGSAVENGVHTNSQRTPERPVLRRPSSGLCLGQTPDLGVSPGGAMIVASHVTCEQCHHQQRVNIHVPTAALVGHLSPSLHATTGNGGSSGGMRHREPSIPAGQIAAMMDTESVAATPLSPGSVRVEDILYYGGVRGTPLGGHRDYHHAHADGFSGGTPLLLPRSVSGTNLSHLGDLHGQLADSGRGSDATTTRADPAAICAAGYSLSEVPPTFLHPSRTHPLSSSQVVGQDQHSHVAAHAHHWERDTEAAEYSPLVMEIIRRLGNVKITKYGRPDPYRFYLVDERRGEYQYDCSGYLLHCFKHAHPMIYETLGHTSKKWTLRSLTWWQLLKRVNEGHSSVDKLLWAPVSSVDALRPGDIVAYIHINDLSRGHVVCIMPDTNPVRKSTAGEHVDSEGGWRAVFMSDSTSAPHWPESGTDSRKRNEDGMGTGYMQLRNLPDLDRDAMLETYRQKLHAAAISSENQSAPPQESLLLNVATPETGSATSQSLSPGAPDLLHSAPSSLGSSDGHHRLPPHHHKTAEGGNTTPRPKPRPSNATRLKGTSSESDKEPLLAAKILGAMQVKWSVSPTSKLIPAIAFAARPIFEEDDAEEDEDGVQCEESDRTGRGGRTRKPRGERGLAT